MTCTYVCTGTPGRRREPAQGSAISGTACQSFQVKSVSEAGVWTQGIDVWKRRQRGGGGGTATDGTRGLLHASSLPFGNAGGVLARKLGFAVPLTFAFLAQTPRGLEQGCCEG